MHREEGSKRDRPRAMFFRNADYEKESFHFFLITKKKNKTGSRTLLYETSSFSQKKKINEWIHDDLNKLQFIFDDRASNKKSRSHVPYSFFSHYYYRSFLSLTKKTKKYFLFRNMCISESEVSSVSLLLSIRKNVYMCECGYICAARCSWLMYTVISHHIYDPLISLSHFTKKYFLFRNICIGKYTTLWLVLET